MKLREREGKLLIDVEEVFEFKCLIDIVIWVILVFFIFLDVIFISKLGLFELIGVVEIGFSDYELICGFFNKVVK